MLQRRTIPPFVEREAMTMSEASAVTQGVHHIGLTVPDLEQTRGFFVDTRGDQQGGYGPEDPAVFWTDHSG